MLHLIGGRDTQAHPAEATVNLSSTVSVKRKEKKRSHFQWCFSKKMTECRFCPAKKEQCFWLHFVSCCGWSKRSGFKISSEENVPSVVPLLQIKNRRLSNYGALSPRNVSLLHFKLCSERWQTNDHFNFYQEEKHMAGANEVSSLILPLTETIWTK